MPERNDPPSDSKPQSSPAGPVQDGDHSEESADDGLPFCGRTLKFPEESLLREWLEGKNPDINPERTAKWNEIGWEVFERKALLLASARDLELNNFRDPMKLAATDIFVEKAQRILTSRANVLYALGALLSLAAIGLLVYAADLIYNTNISEALKPPTVNAGQVPFFTNSQYFTGWVIKSTTVGGLFASVIYLLVALSRALLHEATVLYSRRHSLRFCRGYLFT